MVGVDFGSANTVIAVARNRGVDVVSAFYSFKYNVTLGLIMCNRLQTRFQIGQLR